jgi:Protein of unknown function (DUF4239)
MTYFMAALIFIITIIASGSLIVLIRKYVPIDFLKLHHEVAFVIFLQIGVIYGVLLAFVVSATWNQYNAAAQRIEQEASSLQELWHLKSVFPPAMQKTIEHDLSNYFNSVVSREWALMAQGGEDIQAENDLEDLQKTYFKFKPQTFGESDLYTESLHHLASIREYRRLRLFEARMVIPKVMWLIMIVMGVFVVGISYFFGMRYTMSQVVLITTLVAMITSLLLLIKLLDNPFAGDLRIYPIAFQKGMQQIGISPHGNLP